MFGNEKAEIEYRSSLKLLLETNSNLNDFFFHLNYCRCFSRHMVSSFWPVLLAELLKVILSPLHPPFLVLIVQTFNLHTLREKRNTLNVFLFYFGASLTYSNLAFLPI